MFGYFYIRFIDFMLNNKILTDLANLFSPKKTLKIMIQQSWTHFGIEVNIDIKIGKTPINNFQEQFDNRK